MPEQPKRHIVTGQRVRPEKVAFSRKLRQSMTPAEQVLWERLRAGRLHGLKFRRQQIIDGFIADFYCNSAGLVVEVDGPIHEQQRAYDACRDQFMTARGLQVLRFSNDAVLHDLEAVLCQIHAHCQ